MVFLIFDEKKVEEIVKKNTHVIRGDIEAWSAKGSGWVVDRIVEAQIEVSRYEPCRSGTFSSHRIGPWLVSFKKEVCSGF